MAPGPPPAQPSEGPSGTQLVHPPTLVTPPTRPAVAAVRSMPLPLSEPLSPELLMDLGIPANLDVVLNEPWLDIRVHELFGPGWYCTMCYKWVTDGHLASLKHTRNVAHARAASIPTVVPGAAAAQTAAPSMAQTAAPSTVVPGAVAAPALQELLGDGRDLTNRRRDVWYHRAEEPGSSAGSQCRVPPPPPKALSRANQAWGSWGSWGSWTHQ